MTYRELQQALKQLRNEGKTDIKLNRKKSELQAEYDRLTAGMVAEIHSEMARLVPQLLKTKRRRDAALAEARRAVVA